MSSNVTQKKQLVLLCGAVALSLLYFMSVTRYMMHTWNEAKPLTCEGVLEYLQPPVPSLLIDSSFLRDYEAYNCTIPKRRLKIATLKGAEEVKSDKYEVLLYERETEERHYWRFHDNVTRAIPLLDTYRLGNFVIPSDSRLFSEYWQRSPLVPCLNIPMNRPGSTSFLSPLESVEALSELARLLVSLDMFPFLNGGTLLGFYRECGVIPHTWDMDLAVFVEQYNPLFLDMLENNRTNFNINRRLGRVNDSYELTVFRKGNARPAIDVFFMYTGTNESWVGGTSGSGQKYKYTYPLYNPWCSADLLGHLFWVTCTPDRMLEFEYGPSWKKDHQTRHYAWNLSGHNVKKSSKWSVEEMKDVYVTY